MIINDLQNGLINLTFETTEEREAVNSIIIDTLDQQDYEIFTDRTLILHTKYYSIENLIESINN